MKQLIITADEFGESHDANKAIYELFKAWRITNASLMANTPCAEEAISLAKKSRMKCGVHFNLTFGRPLCDANEVRSLVDKNGYFHAQFEFVARYILGFVDINEIAREFRAQAKRLHDNGIKPTHFDGHCYIHMLPGILNAAIKIAMEYKIDRTRLAYENWSYSSHGVRSLLSYNFLVRWLFVRLLKNKAEAMLRQNKLAYPQRFHGIFLIDNRRFFENMLKIIGNLEDGTHELMVHPSLSGKRHSEYDALKSSLLKETITKNGIKLISYEEL